MSGCPTLQIGIRPLEAVFAILISTMIVTFGIMFVRAGVPYSEVASGFLIPNLPREDIPTVCENNQL